MVNEKLGSWCVLAALMMAGCDIKFPGAEDSGGDGQCLDDFLADLAMDRDVLEAEAAARGINASDLIEERRLIWHDRVGFALQAMGEAPDGIAERTEALKPLDPELRESEVDALERIAGCTPPEWARLMTWEGAEQLLSEGHEIGSHSLRHPLLPTCSDARLRAELVESKAAIEKRLGIRVQTFCYPNGDADQRVATATAAAGYECAVTTTWGTNDPSTPPFLLRRCDMHPFHTRDRHGILSSAQLQFRLSRQL